MTVISSESSLHSPPLSSSSLFPSFLPSSRSLPLQHLVSRPLGTSADGLQEPVKISIPRYVLRGQGKDEHFEFEVKVSSFIFIISRLHPDRFVLLSSASVWLLVVFFLVFYLI